MEPSAAEYPNVPTPTVVDLHRSLLSLQQEKDTLEKEYIHTINVLESKVDNYASTIQALEDTIVNIKREYVLLQQAAIKEERKGWKVKVKNIECTLKRLQADHEAEMQWNYKFMAKKNENRNIVTTGLQHDTVDEIFAKFAQSIALLPSWRAPELTETGVLTFLAHILTTTNSDIVKGSILIALTNLSLYTKRGPEIIRQDKVLKACSTQVQALIISAGIVDAVIDILKDNTNVHVLIEACRLCAALGRHTQTKHTLAAKHTVKNVINLLPKVEASSNDENVAVPNAVEQSNSHTSQDDSTIIDKEILGVKSLQENVFTALVNLSHDSEMFKSQISNLKFIPLAIQYLRDSIDHKVQLQAARLLVNLSFNHSINQSAIVSLEGDSALINYLSLEISKSHPSLLEACISTIGNLCSTNVHQVTFVHKGAMTKLLQIIVDTTNTGVIESSARALCCLCHHHEANQTRFVAQNGIEVILYAIQREISKSCTLSNKYKSQLSPIKKHIPKIENDNIISCSENSCPILIAMCDLIVITIRSNLSRQRAIELDCHKVIIQLLSMLNKNQPQSLFIACAQSLCCLIHRPTKSIQSYQGEHMESQNLLSATLSAFVIVKDLLDASNDSSISENDPYITQGNVHLRQYNAVPKWLIFAIDILQTSQSTSITHALPTEKIATNVPNNVLTTNQYSDKKRNVTDDKPINDCLVLIEPHDKKHYCIEMLSQVYPDALCVNFYEEMQSTK